MSPFLRSSLAAIAALLSCASTDAAYGRMLMSPHPTSALRSMMQPGLEGPWLISRDIRSVMNDVDKMFHSALGFDGLFYNSMPVKRKSRASHLLRDNLALNNGLARVQANASNMGEGAYNIVEDDSRLELAFPVLGAKASGISIQIEGKELKISAISQHQDGDITVHSRFERSFSMPHDVIIDEITAQMHNSVLTVIAPKHQDTKRKGRRIEIVENKFDDEVLKKELPSSHEEKSHGCQQSTVNTVSTDSTESTKSTKSTKSSGSSGSTKSIEDREIQEATPDVDDSVIDLDEEEG